MKPSFCFPRLDVRFMVEVVMLPVLAHYAVCWSGHPTRLAEILRVHSGLFRFLLPDATWGNGLGLREWTPFRLTYRISRYIYIYVYINIYIYLYTHAWSYTNCHINLCLVWPNSGFTSIPKGDLSTDRKTSTAHGKTSQGLSAKQLEKKHQIPKSLPGSSHLRIFFLLLYGSLRIYMQYSLCRWLGRDGSEASTGNHVNSVLTGVIKGAYCTRLVQ